MVLNHSSIFESVLTSNEGFYHLNRVTTILGWLLTPPPHPPAAVIEPFFFQVFLPILVLGE